MMMSITVMAISVMTVTSAADLSGGLVWDLLAKLFWNWVTPLNWNSKWHAFLNIVADLSGLIVAGGGASNDSGSSNTLSFWNWDAFGLGNLSGHLNRNLSADTFNLNLASWSKGNWSSSNSNWT